MHYGLKRPEHETIHSPSSSSEIHNARTFTYTPLYALHKGNFVPVLNEVTCHEDVRVAGGMVPCILTLSARWRWMVSFTSQPLYPRYPLDRRLNGFQSRSDTAVARTKIPSLPCRKSNLGRPAHSLVTILTELSFNMLYIDISLKSLHELW
jgi:hypothetical protein